MPVHVCTCIMAFYNYIFYELVSFRYFRCILGAYDSESLRSTALKISGFRFSKMCS